jgi:3-hydroxy-9,10-secoandrosta-1,3,5(10)-triene-9,17-dione monooxygenase reductase component
MFLPVRHFRSQPRCISLTMTDTRPASARFAPDLIKSAFGHFGTGVAIVTGQSTGVPHGFTCQSVVALSMTPTYIAFSPARSSTTWPLIRPTGLVCINILAADQAALGRTFADRTADRFDNCGWRSGGNGAPALANVLARIEATVVNEIDAGDHTFVIAEPTAFWLDSDRRPLLYYRGAFGSLDDCATTGT